MRSALLLSLLALVITLIGCTRQPVAVLTLRDPLMMNDRILSMEAETPGQFTGSWQVAYRTPIFMPFSLSQTESLYVGAGTWTRWVFRRDDSAHDRRWVAAPDRLLVSADWHLAIGNSAAEYEVDVAVSATVVLQLVACSADYCWYEQAEPPADAQWLSLTVHKTDLPEILSGWPSPLSRVRVRPTLQIRVTDPGRSQPVEFTILSLALKADEALLTYVR